MTEESVRRVTIAALVFICIASLAALAMPRQTLFIRASAQDFQKRIEIVAESMQREGAVTHATGNVQVRITHGDDSRTVIHADEVIYHGDTGEIETRGDARITI
jgi:lipopolysaccharide assembly outer membrane protein LptD (OstA)